MKVKHSITIMSPANTDIVERLICKYYSVIRSLSVLAGRPRKIFVEIINHEQELENFLSELDEEGISYDFWQESTYRKEEITKFEYGYLVLPDIHAIICGSYPTTDDLNPEVYGTKYSDSLCIECNRGKKQLNLLHIPIRTASKFEIGTILRKIIIKSEEMKTFQRKGFTGLSFAKCVDSKTEGEVPYEQLIIDNILPPMSDRTEIEWVKCSHCGNTYWKTIPDKLVFSNDDKSEFMDFNVSFENFSYLGNPIAPAPAGILIVSNRVINYMLENNFSGVKFKPIFFIE